MPPSPLPYFPLQHSNFSSLSRQLCFYNFRKVSKNSSGGVKCVEYSHPYFQRGRPDLLPLIVRKTNTTASAQLEGEGVVRCGVLALFACEPFQSRDAGSLQ